MGTTRRAGATFAGTHLLIRLRRASIFFRVRTILLAYFFHRSNTLLTPSPAQFCMMRAISRCSLLTLRDASARLPLMNWSWSRAMYLCSTQRGASGPGHNEQIW